MDREEIEVGREVVDREREEKRRREKPGWIEEKKGCRGRGRVCVCVRERERGRERERVGRIGRMVYSGVCRSDACTLHKRHIVGQRKDGRLLAQDKLCVRSSLTACNVHSLAHLEPCDALAH